MTIKLKYHSNNTITITCGPDSITIGSPGNGTAALPPPVSAGGDGVVAALRIDSQEVRVGAGDDPATLLRALPAEAKSEIVLMLSREMINPLDVGDILKAAKTTFGEDVKIFFVREGEDG